MCIVTTFWSPCLVYQEALASQSFKVCRYLNARNNQQLYHTLVDQCCSKLASVSYRCLVFDSVWYQFDLTSSHYLKRLMIFTSKLTSTSLPGVSHKCLYKVALFERLCHSAIGWIFLAEWQNHRVQEWFQDTYRRHLGRKRWNGRCWLCSLETRTQFTDHWYRW